ncbi:hypothetical protein B0H11DRAFT_139972 [Mycena galericulata]|nr:hypothetical protein B0H11DRAFT_139972 [Mycena galericulata]
MFSSHDLQIHSKVLPFFICLVHLSNQSRLSAQRLMLMVRSAFYRPLPRPGMYLSKRQQSGLPTFPLTFSATSTSISIYSTTINNELYAPIKVEGQSPAEQSEHGFHSTPPSSNSASPPDDIEWFRRGPSARTLELVSSTHIRLARSVRGTERQRAYGEQEHDAPGSEPFSSYYRSQITPPVLHAATSSSKSKRIPRPPNAFILYRSHILNEARIPDDIERRQQTLSRVAGQCWNLLRPAEKKPWQDLAAKRAAIHQLEHPDYHFKPSPRGKSKAKLRSNEEKSDEVIRSLRETYLGILGPSICASRQRKPKSQVQEEKPTPSSHQSTLASSPSDTPGSGAFHWPSAAGSQGPSYQSTPASTPSLSPFDSPGYERVRLVFLLFPFRFPVSVPSLSRAGL